MRHRIDRLWHRRLALSVVLLLGVDSSALPGRTTLPQEAYVWQRVWTPALSVALRRTAPLVTGLRVLVAEWPSYGPVVRANVDWVELRIVNHVVAVLRIDGRGELPAPDAVRNIVASLPVGAASAGVEIDFDCPTSKLPSYRAFLLALKASLPDGTRLSITALPDWLRADSFKSLTEVVDQVVLQVHATADPRRGLFSQATMMRWVAQTARVSARPFMVALPAYSIRAVFDGSGRVLSTEGERAALAGSAGTELAVSPVEMARAVEALETDTPRQLKGIVWFRVPTEADTRAWSLTSWQAVLGGRSVKSHLTMRRVAASSTGLQLLRLFNDGDVDAALPERIELGPSCLASDGAGPYRLEHSEHSDVLLRAAARLLNAHRVVTVGWTRCAIRDQDFYSPDVN